MHHPGFFERAGPFSLGEVAATAGAELPEGAEGDRKITDIEPLDIATPSSASFFDNRKYLPELRKTKAGACFISPKTASDLPATATALLTPTPYHAFARALALFYPAAERTLTRPDNDEEWVSSDAAIEDGAVIEPGAAVAAGAVIGRGTRIVSGAFVGFRVHIGRDSYVGAHASLTHALIGNRVIIHAGARIGQDGFGFAMGPEGHIRVPQIGRVVIQDDVDIGANTCIDRGALKDTFIGEGSKIDNLVQIGHNVVIGRHCVVVALVGLSGSVVLEDFVAMGGQSGSVGHTRIGTGAQIAAGSGVKDDIPAGAIYGGAPARPLREWAREVAAIRRLAKRDKD